jgi:hypothetical protein
VSPPWEPANDIERSMADALARRDTTEYFRAVAMATLILPAYLADQEAGRPQRMFTWDVEGERYVLAFTSVQAMADCLGTAADAYVTVGYRELVEKWPDATWRLAIDPESPIGAFADVQTVIQAALGEVQVPLPEGQAPAERTTYRPADDFERAIHMAVDDDDTDLLLDGLLLSTVFLPTARPVPEEALGHPGFPWLLAVGEPVPTIWAFTSAGRMAGTMTEPAPSLQVDLIDVLRAWPDPSYRLAVNPGSELGMTFDGSQLPDLISWWEDLAERYGSERPPEASEHRAQRGAERDDSWSSEHRAQRGAERDDS